MVSVAAVRHDAHPSPPVTFIAGWAEINRKARFKSVFPGCIRGHGEAPDGCGNGIRSVVCPPYSTRRRRPITSTNDGHGMNCSIASLPTGITSSGLSRSNYACSHTAQLAISSRDGTRSPPDAFLPGKHRQTAAM